MAGSEIAKAASSKKKDPKTKASSQEPQEDDVVADSNAEESKDGSGAEEEEYEIELILDARKGVFAGGQMGYFVKWKGYDEKENSWIAEADAGNAQDLIDGYWNKKKLEKKKAKPSDAKPPARPRKSAGKDDATAGSAKRRGRKSAGNEDSEMSDAPPVKKARAAAAAANASSAAPRASTQPSVSRLDDEQPIGDMKQYMTVASWEHLVNAIDTVERTDDGQLDVYFRLRSDERVKEKSDICAQRFPQKLIKFYESNLRWKVTEGPDNAT